MSSMSYTPGPWRIESRKTDDGVGWIVTGPSESWMEWGGSTAPYFTQADARLIAAAPDLLAALQGIAGFSHAMAEHDRKYDTLGFMVDCPDERCIAARAAIAEATASTHAEV
jgi:hypothetical protein